MLPIPDDVTGFRADMFDGSGDKKFAMADAQPPSGGGSSVPRRSKRIMEKRGKRSRADDDDAPVDNPAASSYDEDHNRYYWALPRCKMARIADAEMRVARARSCERAAVPIRFRILESGAPLDVVCNVLTKVDGVFRPDTSPGERAKMTKWTEAFLRIPFGVRRMPPVCHTSDTESVMEFMKKTGDMLESSIYGHSDAKKQIIRTIAKWISNPRSRGGVIGVQGPPGCGKTTLVKNCIARAMGIPMVMIPLGGSTDSSYLVGHMYTYEGSTYGSVAGGLMSAGCMNPVFLMDELDKVGGDSKGKDVINALIHLTDPVQNEGFADQYFADVPIDVSQALIVFTFNHEEDINPILKDRMIVIRTKGYTATDKRMIAKRHLLPRIAAQYNIPASDITDEGVDEIVNRVGIEQGVRNLERAIDTIVGNVNLAWMLSGEVSRPVVIDRAAVVDNVPVEKGDSFSAQHIYT